MMVSCAPIVSSKSDEHGALQTFLVEGGDD